jgi:hypothetical protein
MKLNGYIWLQPSEYADNGFTPMFWANDAGTSSYLKGEGYLPVCPHTIEFEFPEGFDYVGKQVECLVTKKEALTAEYEAAVGKIDSAIKNLQCLTFNPTNGTVSVPEMVMPEIVLQAPGPEADDFLPF